MGTCMSGIGIDWVTRRSNSVWPLSTTSSTAAASRPPSEPLHTRVVLSCERGST